MTKLRDLINESKFLKREFGDPLPTFEDVMEKHQVNKLKEGWWDNMSDAAQKAYIKKHGSAPGSAGGDDNGGDGDHEMAPDMDSRDYDMDDDDDKYDKYGQEMGGTPSKLNQETLMIDSKQYRRINESVKQEPKPEYEFSEFYQRFKRQE